MPTTQWYVNIVLLCSEFLFWLWKQDVSFSLKNVWYEKEVSKNISWTTCLAQRNSLWLFSSSISPSLSFILHSWCNGNSSRLCFTSLVNISLTNLASFRILEWEGQNDIYRVCIFSSSANHKSWFRSHPFLLSVCPERLMKGMGLLFLFMPKWLAFFLFSVDSSILWMIIFLGCSPSGRQIQIKVRTFFSLLYAQHFSHHTLEWWTERNHSCQSCKLIPCRKHVKLGRGQWLPYPWFMQWKVSFKYSIYTEFRNRNEGDLSFWTTIKSW